MKSLKQVAIALTAFPLFCSAFYLPGVSPHDYEKGELVTLNVNTLSPSSSSQVKSVISYDYYNEKLHFCKPPKGMQEQAESLGSIIFGDRIFNSPFEVKYPRKKKIYSSMIIKPKRS